MKKGIFLILLSACITGVNAQGSNIPPAVTAAFKAKYPDATNVIWKNKITGMEVDFDLHGKQCEAKYSKKGEWRNTEVFGLEKEIPPAVKDGLNKSKYREWKIESVRLRSNSDGTEDYHIIVAKNDIIKKDLIFNKKGQLLKNNITI